MGDNITSLECNTLRRLCRQGRAVEAGRYLREQFATITCEPDFQDAFLTVFIPSILQSAKVDGDSTTEAIYLAWQIIESYKLYPEDQALNQLQRLVLPAVEWLHGQEAAATLALRHPTLPNASEYRSRDAARRAARGHQPELATSTVVRMERHITVTNYRIGKWEASSANPASARRTLLRSPQERELMKAARAFFVGREVFPNVRLSNFIDLDYLDGKLPAEIRRYARMAEADILIATPVDFDPIGIIELDSAYHDVPAARRRDKMKERLMELAGIPFVRLRAESGTGIRADDFYSLMETQWAKFEIFKPQGWREREEHARLCPAA